MANFMDTGNGYPSTATPFAMDLATPIMAITQQMVKRRKEEIATEKAVISENEATMLKAMDFEVVKGLSDKIQEEHVNAIEKFKDDYTQVYVKYDGKLPPAERLNMIRAQKAIETDIADKKANVLAFAELQKFIQTNPKAREILDVDATTKKMAEWASSGKIGADGASFLAVPRVWNGAELFQRDLGAGLKNILDNRNETVDVNGKIITTTKFTPEQIKADVMKQIDTMPWNEGQKEEARQYALTQLPENVVQSVKYPPVPRVATDKSGAMINAAAPANELLDGVWNMDKGATANLTANALFSKTRWDMSNPKDPVIVLTKFDGGTIKIPKSVGEKRFKEIINENLADAIRIKKDAGALIQTGGIPGKKYQIAEPEDIATFDNALSKYKEPMIDPTNPKGAKIPGHKFVEKMLKATLPNGWRVDRSLGRDIRVFSPDGEKYQFDYTVPEDAERLKKFYREHSKQGAGYKEITGEKKEDIDPLGIL